MDKIYAELIIKDAKLFSEVPSLLKEKVKIILQGFISQNIITQEEFEVFISK